MDIEEMMGSLEINGKTYFEAYLEVEAKLIRSQKIRESRERASLLNMLALHYFPLTGQVIAKHQLLKWKRPADLARDLKDVARLVWTLDECPRPDLSQDSAIPQRKDLINSIKYKEGMTPAEYERLALSVGAVLRRICPYRLETIVEARSEFQPVDRLLAEKVELAYKLIFYEEEIS